MREIADQSTPIVQRFTNHQTPTPRVTSSSTSNLFLLWWTRRRAILEHGNSKRTTLARSFNAPVMMSPVIKCFYNLVIKVQVVIVNHWSKVVKKQWQHRWPQKKRLHIFLTGHYVTPKAFYHCILSLLWRCWLGGMKGIWPVKTEWWGTSVVICLERAANDLYMVQLMSLSFIPSALDSLKSRCI